MRLLKAGIKATKGAEGMAKLADVVAKAGGDVMLVVPAIEESYCALENMVEALSKNEQEQAEQYWFAVLDEHVYWMQDLGLKPNEDVRIPMMPEYDTECSYEQNYHQIVSLAAILSSQIVAVYLLKSGVDTEWWNTSRFILTESENEKLRLDLAYSEQIIRAGWHRDGRKSVVVLAGGIGGTKDGKQTCFGSAGADLTAELMKNFLGAESIEGIIL